VQAAAIIVARTSSANSSCRHIQRAVLAEPDLRITLYACSSCGTGRDSCGVKCPHSLFGEFHGGTSDMATETRVMSMSMKLNRN